MTTVYPDPFLEIRVQLLDLHPSSIALCAGYEAGAWRSDGLAEHMFQWLPYAALSQEHQLAFGQHNFVELLKVAAAHIYNTKKTSSRGELGELLLHLACTLHFGAVPVMCKLILKSASNDTVKGFDGVHLVPSGDAFEVWLGESKFYSDGKDAIRDAVKSVRAHIAPKFISAEKAMIIGHISKDIPFRDRVIKLFKSHTSGDKLLAMAVFPVLISYDSECVKSFHEVSERYAQALRLEVDGLRDYFSKQAHDLKLRFQLILIPMQTKANLISRFDQLLKAFI